MTNQDVESDKHSQASPRTETEISSNDDSEAEVVSTDVNDVSSAEKRNLLKKSIVIWSVAILIILVLTYSLLRIPNKRFEISLITIGLLVALVLIKAPKWQVARLKDLKPDEQFDKENEARKTLAQIIGGILVLAGLYYTQDNIRTTQEVAERNREVTREGQVTDRFTKAIEQLGSEKLEIRLGSLYALERVANDSERDSGVVTEILCAFIRDYTHPQSKIQVTPSDSRRIDIQAAVTILGRRKFTEQMIDLSNCKLDSLTFTGNYSKAKFLGSSLTGVYIYNADLSGAFLVDVNLANAHFDDVSFEGASLWKSNLNEVSMNRVVNFKKARLISTSFVNAKLSTNADADFQDAIIGSSTNYDDVTGEGLADSNSTNFKGADIRGAKNLTKGQLEKAIVDDNTKLPDYLLHQ